MNTVVLAVAGGRKTQAIVEACAGCPDDRRILVLGYTTASQDELAGRIRAAGVLDRRVEVMGWYAFLLRHVIRPYLPLVFPGRRLAGLNFEGDPGRFASEAPRFLDADSRAYKLHLASLAHQVLVHARSGVMNRLEHIYDEIYVDEVQDLGGWDLNIVEALLRSRLQITMVGDMRQALLSTNIRDPKNKQYRQEKIVDWFRLMQTRRLLDIEQRPITYRSNQAIADFSDTIFDPALGYAATVSRSDEVHHHSGLFAVREEYAAEYVARFHARCLRHSVASGSHLDLPFSNFGIAKGTTSAHVLIYPTAAIRSFLLRGGHLSGRVACSLYIGVTRAQHSVAFLMDETPPGFERWQP